MRLLINYVTVLVFAVTGFLAFYLVIIDFIEHLKDADKAMLWFHIACSVLIAAGGAIVAWRKKLGAIIVLLCLISLLNIWLSYTGLYTNEIAAHQIPESAPIIRKFFPASYVISAIFAVIQLIMPMRTTHQ